MQGLDELIKKNKKQTALFAMRWRKIIHMYAYIFI